LSASNSPILACILGCSGLTLTESEKAFFAKTNPLGFILFARNVDNPAQVKTLVDDLRAVVGRSDAPVLIDQEGGRVQRLRPPHWRKAPNGEVFAKLAAVDLEKAKELLRLNYRLIGAELAELGIDVDCAPVVDVPVPGSHDVIGDRALGHDPVQVATLAKEVMEGLLDQGIMPIIKHIPGHGRAMVDSHLSLPVVDHDKRSLQATDFKSFNLVSDAPWAMTAHVVYTAIDADRPATTSPKVIGEIIRGEIGFDGVLISDDLSMKALGGSFTDRAHDSLAAGCDLVLHCNGDMEEMVGVVAGTLPLTEMAQVRLDRANAMRRNLPPPNKETSAALVAEAVPCTT
jgi:beta-N-acetylhexosaminidase